MTVHLEEDGGHRSTSGIGLYPKTFCGIPVKDALTFYSSTDVVKVVATSEMKTTLNKVHHSFFTGEVVPVKEITEDYLKDKHGELYYYVYLKGAEAAESKAEYEEAIRIATEIASQKAFEDKYPL